jgi:hypothetical protein
MVIYTRQYAIGCRLSVFIDLPMLQRTTYYIHLKTSMPLESSTASFVVVEDKIRTEQHYFSPRFSRLMYVVTVGRRHNQEVPGILALKVVEFQLTFVNLYFGHRSLTQIFSVHSILVSSAYAMSFPSGPDAVLLMGVRYLTDGYLSERCSCANANSAAPW